MPSVLLLLHHPAVNMMGSFMNHRTASANNCSVWVTPAGLLPATACKQHWLLWFFHETPACCRRLNPIHVAAIFRRLASIVQSANQAHTASAAAAAPAGASASCQQLVRQLQGQLKQQHCMGHGPRGLANILAALAKLQCSPDFEMLQMLLQGFCSQLYDAVPEDIANVLWGAAQLTISYGASPAPGAAGAAAVGHSFRDGAVAAAAAAAKSDVQQEGGPADEPADTATHFANLVAVAAVHAGALQADVGPTS
jgi:hypothetical protein